jgi:hypothetical protein
MSETFEEPENLDKPVWGARDIGKEIGKPTRATYHLLEKGLLPATKIGGQWASTPRRLRGLTAPS